MIAGQKMQCLGVSSSQCNCAPEHDCLQKWYESSKAMEPDVVVSMAKSLKQEGIKLGALVADDVFMYHYSLLSQAWHALPQTEHFSFQ